MKRVCHGCNAVKIRRRESDLQMAAELRGRGLAGCRNDKLYRYLCGGRGRFVRILEPVWSICGPGGRSLEFWQPRPVSLLAIVVEDHSLSASNPFPYPFATWHRLTAADVHHDKYRAVVLV